MNDKSLKRIIFLLSGMFVILCIAQYFLYSEIRTKNENISRVQIDLNNQESRQGYLISMQKLLDGLSSDINDITGSIVAKGQDVDFVEYLESVSKISGVELKIDNLSYEDSPTLKNTNITTLKIKANTDGTWKAIYSFLVQLESLPYKVKINKFAMVNVPDDSETKGKVVKSHWKSSFEIIVLKYK